jgi:hypothetical protein
MIQFLNSELSSQKATDHDNAKMQDEGFAQNGESATAEMTSIRKVAKESIEQEKVQAAKKEEDEVCGTHALRVCKVLRECTVAVRSVGTVRQVS